jgi:hypothetical protein
MSLSRQPHSSLDRIALSDADYEAIETAVMETARGRWFLSEYARRQRRAETETILAALDALARTIQKQQPQQQGVAASYNASARFTTCLQAGVTIPGQPGEPPRVRPAQPGALAVPAPRQSLSAVTGAGTAMSGTQDDAARSSLLLEAPDALDYSLLGKVA